MKTVKSQSAIVDYSLHLYPFCDFFAVFVYLFCHIYDGKAFHTRGLATEKVQSSTCLHGRTRIIYDADWNCFSEYIWCLVWAVDADGGWWCVFSLPYLETSAATGENVEAAVSTLLNRVMLHVDEIIDVTNKYISVVNGNTIKWMKYDAVDEAEDDSRKHNGCAC